MISRTNICILGLMTIFGQNIELYLATLLFRSAVGENPHLLLNFDLAPTMAATEASGINYLDDSSTLWNFA